MNDALGSIWMNVVFICHGAVGPHHHNKPTVLVLGHSIVCMLGHPMKQIGDLNNSCLFTFTLNLLYLLHLFMVIIGCSI